MKQNEGGPLFGNENPGCLEKSLKGQSGFFEGRFTEPGCFEKVSLDQVLAVGGQGLVCVQGERKNQKETDFQSSNDAISPGIFSIPQRWEARYP